MTPIDPALVDRALRKLELGQPLDQHERAAIEYLNAQLAERAVRQKVAAARPPASPPPRRVFVNRRTFEMMQPRPKKVPHSAADGAVLRAAELRRRSKAAKRARAHHKVRLLELPAAAPTPAPDARSACD